MNRPAAPRGRAPGTRLSRSGTRPQMLESVATEYAMLAQRRARLMRQIDLLDRQRQGADANFRMLVVRMATLCLQIPELEMKAVAQHAGAMAEAPGAAPPAEPVPPPLRPRRRGMTLEY